jgi:hypothetical protein
MASIKLGSPVKMEGLRLLFLPLPHLRLDDVRVGKGEVSASRISVYPQLTSLFSQPRVVRLVEVEGLLVNEGAVGVLKRRSDDGGPSSITVRRIRLRDARPQMKGQSFGAWDAEVDLEDVPPAGLRIARAELKSADAGLVAHLVSSGDHRWNIDIEGRDWALPAGPALAFASLDAHGTVTDREVDLPDIQARFYGGTLQGAFTAQFSPRWQWAGRYSVKDVDVAPLVKVFMPKQALGGRLDTDGRISGRATRPDALADATAVNGHFAVKNGVLHGIDLASAAGRLMGGKSGGETRFDDFRGTYGVQRHGVKLRQLVMASGALEATGRIDIAKGGRLDGSMDVELRNTAGLVGVPLAFSGTLADPMVTPTKGSTIGAAVGTAVLPGIGTSLGASIGRFLERKMEQ